MKKKGFTLIELLVVIAIIGILVTIVVVALANARVEARAVAFRASLRSATPGITMCCGIVGDIETDANLAGGADLCIPVVNAVLPTAAELNVTGVVYTSTARCNTAAPSIQADITGHPRGAACDGNWIISERGLTAPAGC